MAVVLALTNAGRSPQALSAVSSGGDAGSRLLLLVPRMQRLGKEVMWDEGEFEAKYNEVWEHARKKVCASGCEMQP